MNSKRIAPYLLIAPGIIIIVLLLIYPIIYSVTLSFKSNSLSLATSEVFVGFNNYIKLFKDNSFWNSLKVTIIYTLSTVLGSLVIGLIIALFLEKEFRFRLLFRGIMIMPWALAEVVTVLIWVWMYDPQYGLFKYIISLFGLDVKDLVFLSNSKFALVCVIITTIWKLYPFATLMFLAGLQSIPKENYEAAQVDGANWFGQFKNITIPGLSNVTKTLTLLQTLWGFSSLVIIYLLTRGGPARATETLVVQMYLKAFKFFDINYAAAIGTVILFLSLIFVMLYVLILKRGLKNE